MFFFWKFILSSHGHVVLLLPYRPIRQNFSFRQLFPVDSEIAPKEKYFTPIFSETSVNFRTFFHHRIRFDWGHKRHRPEGAEIRRLGWGQKQIFETSEKFLFIATIGKFSFPTNLLVRQGHPLYVILKICRRLGYQFSRKWGLILTAVKCWYSLEVMKISRKSRIKFSQKLKTSSYDNSFLENLTFHDAMSVIADRLLR